MIVSAHIRLDSSLSGNVCWHWPPTAARELLMCDADGAAPRLLVNGDVERRWNHPLDALRWLAADATSRAPRSGRWIGFLSYDLGRYFEQLPATAHDDLRLPLYAFAWCPASVPAAAPPPAQATGPSPAGGMSRTFTREAFERAVARAVEYIAAGDIFQVNLAQRFSVNMPDVPAAVYARLLERHPAWYGGYLDFGDFCLLSNSPELFLRISRDGPDRPRRVITRPIKGTRPRRPGMDVELLHSIKDQAELNMIVDLERNDMGRVCRIGSVRVLEGRVIEAHPTVYHGVATIEGLLREDVGFVELLAAVFPGGSVTGAPKIRAMQIIEELEPVRRGPYCGAIGYLAPDGSMEFNIAIRTIVVKGGVAHVSVGGGIVADSQPRAEYEETLTKATAMFDALGVNQA